MPSFRIYNKTDSKVQVFVSKYSNGSGDDAWFPLEAGSYEDWNRGSWELVAVEYHNKHRSGAYGLPGTYEIRSKKVKKVD